MGRTKKVGTAGRFGTRYGAKLRKKVSEIEEKQRKKYECPKCHSVQVKRASAGIWHCRKCDYKFAGRAYFLGE